MFYLNCGGLCPVADENKWNIENRCENVFWIKTENNLKTEQETDVDVWEPAVPLAWITALKMIQGQSAVWTDAHILLLLYVHLRVMNAREAALQSTDKFVWLNLSYKDWSQKDFDSWVIWTLLTNSYCDGTEEVLSVTSHQRKLHLGVITLSSSANDDWKSSHQSFYKVSLPYWWQEHSNNFFEFV